VGFFFTILYVFFLMVRPQEFVEAIRGWPVLDFMAGASLAGVFLEGGFSAEKFRRSVLNKLVLLFWLAISFSHLANFWFGGALHYFNQFAKVAIVYYLIVLTVDTQRRLRIFLWVVLCMVVILALQSIVQYYTGAGLLGGGHALLEAHIVRTRGVGIFGDPNDLALAIVTWMSFLLPAFHKPFLSRTIFTGLILLLPAVSGVAFTRSRGGILGMAAVFWYYFYKRAGIIAALVALAIMGSIFLALPRMGKIDTKEASARGRMEHWSVGLQLFKNHPLAGVGAGRFTEYHYRTAHNSFILVLAELGIVGAWVWVAMFVAAFREIRLMRRIPRAPPFLDRMLDALGGCLVGWLTTAFFLSQSYKQLSFMVMGVIVATLNVLAGEGYEIKNAWSPKWTFISLLITVGGVIFMHAVLIILWRL